MRVTIRIRLTPFWRSAQALKARKALAPHPQRMMSFGQATLVRRGAPPLAIWAVSTLLMLALLSVSMFATLPTSPIETDIAALNEDDPGQPVIGQVARDCRIMIAMSGKLQCLESTEYRPDDSTIVSIGPSHHGTFR